MLYFLKVEHKFIEVIMGGLGGHMAHPYEDMELTFGQLKSMFWLASKGKFSETTEKFDGQNVFFTYTSNGLRFARNITDIKTGGMISSDIQMKWSTGIPHLATAFCKAYDVLSQSFSSLTVDERNAIFGIDNPVWYSAELLFSITRNVYHYDRDSIIIHKSGTIYDIDGTPLSIDTKANFAFLLNSISKLQTPNTNVSIKGPAHIDMSKSLDEYSLRSAIIDLEMIMNQHHLDNDNHIKDMVIDYVADNVLNYINADYDTKLYVSEQLVAIDQLINPRKSRLKSLVAEQLLTKEDFKSISALFKEMPKLYMEVIEPIRKVVRDFGISLLKLYQSTLIIDSKNEIQRLKEVFNIDSKKIKRIGTEHQRNIFHKEFLRLESVNNISSSMEGIVFCFNNKVYKFTGAFGPLNSILGILKYGR